jgi:hypothetical protein
MAQSNPAMDKRTRAIASGTQNGANTHTQGQAM